MSDNEVSDVEKERNKYMMLQGQQYQNKNARENDSAMNIEDNFDQEEDLLKPKMSQNVDSNVPSQARPIEARYKVISWKQFTYPEVKSELATSDGDNHNQVIGSFLKNFKEYVPQQITEVISVILSRTYFSMREIPILVKYVWTISQIIHEIGNLQTYHIAKFTRAISNILNRNCQFYNAIYSVSDFLPKFQLMCKENNSMYYVETMRKIQEKTQGKEDQTDLLSMQLTELLHQFINHLVCQNIMKKTLQNVQETRNIKIPITILLTKISKESFMSLHLEISKHSDAILSVKESQLKQLSKNDAESYCLSLLEVCDIIEVERSCQKQKYQQKSEQMFQQKFQQKSQSRKYSEKYIYPLVTSLLSENSTIEKKLLGMKMLNEKVQQAKVRPNINFVKWLKSSNLIGRLLKDDTHVQILRKIPLVLRFLHQFGEIDEQEISKIIQEGLIGHEQLLKVVQSFIMCLKIQQIDNVFDIIQTHRDLESHNLVNLIYSIVNSPMLINLNRKKTKKGVVVTSSNKKPQQAFQMQEIEEEHNPKFQKLVTKMFTFLIKVIENHHTLYMGTLNKLLSSQQKILMDYLPDQLLNLFRKNHICAVWLLQISLKMDLAKQKGEKTSKYDFIQKLALEGLYQYLFAILVRNRFNKVIVEKISNVLVYLCRYYKPLEKHQTEFLWRVLGMRSRDEKQREQFFNFIKEALRYDSLLTEESVNYIYFEIFMRQHHSWYSLRVYDCLQMLFMRLNEDCKQICYLTTSQQYQVDDPDLVGLDKFWYIYFHCVDSKVVKKSKQFLCKLVFYPSKIRKQLYENYLGIIMGNMKAAEDTQQGREILRRGFQIIDRISEAKRQEILNFSYTPPNNLNLNISNCTKEALPPTKVVIRISETATIARLRELIGSSINPPNQDIEIMTRGQELKGQKMTLKEKNIVDGQTITAENKYVQKKSEEIQKTMNQQFETLNQIFGAQTDSKIIRFLVQKMEGQTIEKMIETLTDQQKMGLIQIQLEEKNFNKEKNDDVDLPTFGCSLEVNVPDANQFLKGIQNIEPIGNNCNKKQESMMNQQINENAKQLKPADFIKMLSQNVSHLNILLSSSEKLDTKQGSFSYWKKIKKLPINQQISSSLQTLTKQNSWKQIFRNNKKMQIIYNLHVLSIQNKSSQQRSEQLMVFRKGFEFLSSYLKELVQTNSDIKLIDGVISIINQFLKRQSSLQNKFDKIVDNVNEKISNIDLFAGFCSTEHDFLGKNFDLSIVRKIIQLLLKERQEISVTKNLFKYILCFMQNQSTKRHLNDKKHISEDEVPSDMEFQEQQIDYLFVNQDKQTIFKLLLYYGRLSQFMFIFQFSYESSQRKKISSSILNKLTFYLDKKISTQFQIESGNYVSFYSLYTFAMTVYNRFSQDELIRIVDIMIEKMNYSTGQQLQGELILMGTICNLADGSSQNLSNKLTDLAIWLYSSLLFGLANPHKQIRNKEIRKAAYDTLLSIARFNQILKQLVISSVLQFQIGKRNKEEDMIDFRGSDYVGIRNLGATCYINSLLQQLFHTRLSLLLLQNKQKNECTGQNKSKMDLQENHNQKSNQFQQDQEKTSLYKLKMLFAQLYKSNKNVVDARPFIQSFLFYGEAINPSIQQDSTQFLMCLMDTIEQQGYKKDLQAVFGGTLTNQITGLQQGQQFIKNNQEHFKTISIDIKGKKNLHEALAFFIKGQNLENQNMYFSEQLGRKTRATKRTFFDKMPNILIFTLKRFEFDYENMIRYKLNDYFEFPLDLDMQKYTSMYLKHNQENSQFKYRLAGILVHSGMAQSGHYYSYIKVGEKWMQFNDRQVSEFNIQANIKNQCFGASEGKNRNAYMLFYEKVQSNFHGVCLGELQEGSNKYLRVAASQNLQFLKNRLTFDSGYVNFIKELSKQEGGENLQSLLTELGVGVVSNKENGDQNNQPTVYFDIQENKPLLPDQDAAMNQAFVDFDQYDGRNEGNGGQNQTNNDLFNELLGDDRNGRM